MKYDSIVVGGGMAGLSAAAYLAKAGKKVLLLERQPTVGGLVQTFQRDGVYFDAGLRSIENSGIVFPMLRLLGIEIDFVKSPVTIGIGDKVLRLEDQGSLDAYGDFLKSQFPGNKADIAAIMAQIRKIMGYMDVLYGVDNPAFLDPRKDRDYFLKVILPWMLRFILTIRRINRLKEPVEDYLKRFTNNQALIDMIAQHFFRATPTSFALSYFSLYLDYYYPKGGTATLARRLEHFILANGGKILTSTGLSSFNPESRLVIDDKGLEHHCRTLVWAADMKQLYRSVDLNSLKDGKLRNIVGERRAALKDLRGGDSVFTVYLTLDCDKEHFAGICSGHFFYTPDKRGLSSLNDSTLREFMVAMPDKAGDADLKNRLRDYIREYFRLNTFEIAIPALRDPSMAPEGKTGLVVSLLFDYSLARRMDEFGWGVEMREWMEKCSVDVLNDSIFPGLAGMVVSRFSSSPLTIEKMTGNTDGGITGWAFTNPTMPAVSHMLKVAKSVETPIPHVFQAGQWVYSPSGLPISMLTGKLAADKALKDLRAESAAADES